MTKERRTHDQKYDRFRAMRESDGRLQDFCRDESGESPISGSEYQDAEEVQLF